MLPEQVSSSSSTSASAAGIAYRQPPESTAYTVNEVLRKRHYRTGLNIFNKKPEKGVAYLIRRGFLENSPSAVSRFLITRKGLSKQMIGEYLGNIALPFNVATLNCFALEMDFSGMQIDTGELLSCCEKEHIALVKIYNYRTLIKINYDQKCQWSICKFFQE